MAEGLKNKNIEAIMGCQDSSNWTAEDLVKTD